MLKHNFPEELISKDNWIIHKEKTPKNPKTGKNLTGPVDKWGVNFDDACKALEKYKASGLGFVFTANNEYCGIDLDSCIENGVVNEKAKSIINSCNSYTEKSFSGTGIHIIVKSTDKGKKLYKKNGVEIYDRSRYFTMSGFGLDGRDKVSTIDVNNLLQKIVESKNGDGKVDNKNEKHEGALNSTQVQELVERISSSGNGDKFKILWNGNWNQLYESHSEADMAFCGILAFWLQEAVQIDQVFRLSKMFRDKWDRSVGQGKTYGQLLIEKTLLHKEGAITANSLVIEIDTFKTMEMPEIKTIMSPWLTFGSTHMIYAKRGVGKTFLSMSLSLAVTHGSDFGEWELKEAVNTMYVDGEMLPQHMKQRIEYLQPNYLKKQKNWYILSSGINLQNNGLAINIAKPYWQDFIFNEVASKDIKLLFLDNISALTPGIEENESTSWDIIATWINKLKQTGCAVVLIHHAGKGGSQRGTSAREDALDTVMFLRKTTEDPTAGIDIDVVFEKSRHLAGAKVASINAKLIQEPGTSNLIWNFNSPNTSRRNEVLQLLVDGKSYEEIRELLQIGKSAITKHKKEATDKSWIGESKGKIFFTAAGEIAVRGKGGNDYGF